MQSLASLQKGHEFPAADFVLSPEWVNGYVAAVEDGAIVGLGPDLVPPTSVAALSIRALLEAVDLPPGAIHVGQELAFEREARAGERLVVNASIASRGERGGWVLISVDMKVSRGADEVMTGRSLVTFPAEAAA